MLVAVRKVMEKIFNLHELEVLDDLMPENIKKQKAELEALKKKDDDFDYDEHGCDGDDPDGKMVKIEFTCFLNFPILHSFLRVSLCLWKVVSLTKWFDWVWKLSDVT